MLSRGGDPAEGQGDEGRGPDRINEIIANLFIPKLTVPLPMAGTVKKTITPVRERPKRRLELF